MKKAFTLVEILFVLVIIGLLSAILLTAYSSSRAKSHETVCLNNLRQIGLGIKMYESDYGDLPHEFKSLHPAYISDKRTLLCPEWLAYITTLPADKQKKYSAYLTRYTYEPEEVKFWQEVPRESGDPELFHSAWEVFYDKRGEHLPLVVCQYHDPFLGSMPIGPDGKLQLTRLVLRLDGSVEKATAHQKGKGVSWSDL